MFLEINSLLCRTKSKRTLMSKLWLMDISLNTLLPNKQKKWNMKFNLIFHFLGLTCTCNVVMVDIYEDNLFEV